MTAVEHKSDFDLTKNTPYLTLMDEVWDICCEDLGENWSRYNGIALYSVDSNMSLSVDIGVLLIQECFDRKQLRFSKKQ